MYIAIDLILAVILAAVILGAWKRGFIRSVFQLCSTVASVVIAVLFYKELSNYFYTAFVFDKTYGYVGGFLENFTAELQTGIDASAIAGALPEQVHRMTKMLGIELEAVLQQYLRPDNLISLDALCESLSLSIASVISNIIAFAALFFGALILLGLAGFLLDKVAKLPVLKGTNKFLGFLLGILEALILGMVLAKVAVWLCSAYGAMHPEFAFTDIAGNTYIAKFLLDICPW